MKEKEQTYILKLKYLIFNLVVINLSFDGATIDNHCYNGGEQRIFVVSPEFKYNAQSLVWVQTHTHYICVYIFIIYEYTHI